MPRIAADDLLRGIVVPLAEERDVDTLRQISLLLERENQRLIAKNLQLTAELARLRGLPEVAQLTFAVEQTLQQTRAAILDGAPATAPRPSRPPRPGHGPREQPAVCEGEDRITPDRFTCSGSSEANCPFIVPIVHGTLMTNHPSRISVAIGASERASAR